MASDIQRPPVDLADDVEAVLALEAPIRRLLEMIEAAAPALARLEAAGYPGADHRSSLKFNFEQLAYNRLIGPERRRTCDALVSLERLRIGDGNQAALDHHEFILQEQMELGEAVAALVDREDNVDRVEAFIQYAKAQASS